MNCLLKKCLLVCILLTFFSYNVKAQNSKHVKTLHSLKKEFYNFEKDKDRILGEAYATAISYKNDSTALNNIFTSNDVFDRLLLIYQYIIESNTSKSIQLTNKLLKEIEDKESRVYIEVLIYNAYAYFELGDIDKAIKKSSNALSIAKKKNYAFAEAFLQKNLGIFYSSIGDFKQAKNYFFSALKASKKNNLKLESKILGNIGKFYSLQDSLQKTLQYELQTMQYYKTHKKSGNNVALNYNNIASTYIGLDSLDKAKKHIKKAYDENPNGKVKSFLDINQAILAEKRNKPKEAILHYEKALHFLQKNTVNFRVAEIYLSLSNLYKLENNFSKSLFYYEKYSEVRFDIFGRKSKKIIEDLELSQKITKVEKENELLALKSYSQKIKYSIIAVAALLLAALLFLMYRRKIKQNTILLNQTKHLASSLAKQKALNNVKKIKKPSSKEKKNNNIPKQTYDKIVVGLEDLINSNFYLMKDCTLSNVSKLVKTNSKYLSIVIREEKGKSFGDFVNELRIKYALIKLETSPVFRNYTVTSMALELGYKERKSFAKSFFNFTGITLASYLANLKEE